MVTAAKRILPLLLASVTLLAGTRDESLNFEIAVPESLAWQTVAVDPTTKWRAHFATSSGAAVLLMVVKDTRPGSLKEAAARWRPSMESNLDVKTRATREARLAGATWLVTEVAGEGPHGKQALDWWITRRDEYVYCLFERRTGRALGDALVRKEIAAIRETFRFLRAARPPPKPEPAPAPEIVPAKTFRLAHWRLELEKPAGWREVALDESEKANDVILKFEGQAEQTRCIVRVYAQTRVHPRHTALKKLAEQIEERFEKTYEKREPSETGRWKLPLARRGIQLRLTGLRRTPETIRWYLADCRNDRQYRIEIHVLGAEDPWRAACDQFLADFQPKKRLR